MVALDPTKRPSIEQILSHPWVAGGDIATADEIRLEFRQRLKVKQEADAAEAAAKKKEKEKVYLNYNKQYKSGDGDDDAATLKPKKTLE